MVFGKTNTGGGSLSFGPFPAGTVLTFFNCAHESTTQISTFTLTVCEEVLCVDSLPILSARPWFKMPRSGFVVFDITVFDPASKFSVFIAVKYPF